MAERRSYIMSKTYKIEAIKTAEDLHYGDAVIIQIQKAKSDEEITRIMINARERKWKPQVRRKECITWFESILV